MNQPPSNRLPDEPRLRDHTYDGIQEFDQRLPNWWLNTLYGAIAFALVYWFIYQTAHVMPTDGQRVDAAMARIEAAKMASTLELTDASLWQMSRNPVFTEAGRQTYTSLCVACHMANLQGGVGPNLSDHAWLHGGRPTEVIATVLNGVPAKGMPTWGPVIGQKKAAEVVAFILSHHTEGEPIEVQASFTPTAPAASAP
jgi:cytochrome c oxidase cbb3-type subunit 3